MTKRSSCWYKALNGLAAQEPGSVWPRKWWQIEVFGMRRVFGIATVVAMVLSLGGCRKEDRDRTCVEPQERTPQEGMIALERVRLDEEGFDRLDEWMEGLRTEEVAKVYDDIARACGDCPEALVRGALAFVRRDPKTGKELGKLVLQEIGEYESPSVEELRRQVGVESGEKEPSRTDANESAPGDL